MAVGTPFELSNHDSSHFMNSKMPMVAPTVDATVATALFQQSTPSMAAVSPFFPGVPTHAPIQPMEAVGTPLGLFNEDLSQSNNYYSHSNNLKMPMVVPKGHIQLTHQQMMGTPVRPTLLHDTFNAGSQFLYKLPSLVAFNRASIIIVFFSISSSSKYILYVIISAAKSNNTSFLHAPRSGLVRPFDPKR